MHLRVMGAQRGRGAPLSRSRVAAAVVAILASAATQAQDAERESDLGLTEVTVTGTRVRDGGFAAPTPLTTMGDTELQAVAPVDISEALMQVPQFSTTSQPSTAVAYANLRGLGAERTLLLIDGRRHVPTFSSGVVDLTTIPTALIARTEVVTGGASASWGSDAVAGVINLILKEDLQGIESTVQGGISEYGDDESVSVSLAGGTSFAGGRGHILVGGEYAKSKGVGPLFGEGSRPWAGRGSVANNSTTNGLPELIYADDIRSANLWKGGLITSGPLRGTTFLPGGGTGQFQYGQVFGTDMIGGGDNYLDIPGPAGPLVYPYERTGLFGRVNYEFTPALKGFTELSYSESLSEAKAIMGQVGGSVAENRGCTTTNLSGSTLNVHINNAFLPDEVRQMMVDAGITCFNMGRLLEEEGINYTRTGEGSPHIYRGVLGLKGEINSRWSWDTYVQYGEATFQQRRGHNIHLTRFNAAIDAVRDPVTNNIVCRINIDASTANDDPACVPFNLFGQGAPSAEAQAYVTGTSKMDMKIEQTVVALNVNGELGELWAGPVSVAFGAEYREESIDAKVDPDSQASRWRTSNRKAIEGSYDVKEAYAEVAIPLLEDKPFARSLGLSLAGRYTDYSSSGGVNTWKVGSTWDVTDSVRFRATQSRDIRAGNLGELFTPTATSLVSIFNPITSLINTPVQVTTSGNPNLDPEEADTFTAGVVFSPRFLRGLQASVDYYSIDIDGQIASINGQQVADLCFEQQALCDRITTDANGVITAINTSFANLNRFKTSGVDIELRYVRPLEIVPGDISMRLLGTYVKESEITYLTDGTSEDVAGEFATPHWKAFAFINYNVGPFGAGLDVRWYEGGKLDNNRVEGGVGSGTTNVNNMGSLAYTSLNLTYDANLAGMKRFQIFARVDNLFDREPPFPLTSAFNDNAGRGYRAGVRMSF
jgi:iron complex outermembrane receptor protein